MKKIIFIHTGKANLPELDAYRKYFSNSYKINIIKIDDLNQTKFDKNTILWFIMGVYTKRYTAGYIIHDYRSLSVGKFPKIKNILKKYINQEPDARIFLNYTIEKELNFKQTNPKFFIDMGIPETITKYLNSNSKINKDNKYDFVYVGDVSFEREIDILIKKFLDTYSSKKTLLLIGNYDKEIYDKYHTKENLIFTGKIPQEKVFHYLSQSSICINFMPNRYPHSLQTPTKLLEYAALKKKVISNERIALFETMKKNNINSYITKGYSFPKISELKNIPDNTQFDLNTILWDKIIRNSKIEKSLP